MTYRAGDRVSVEVPPDPLTKRGGGTIRGTVLADTRPEDDYLRVEPDYLGGIIFAPFARVRPEPVTNRTA